MPACKTWILGLTGGIASGKSTASDWLARAGCAVIDADVESRAATAPGGEAIAEIARCFGPEFILKEGGLDRARMRALAFSDPAARRRLESIVHPAVRRRIERRLEHPEGCYAVLVIPLLASMLRYRARISRLLVIDLPQPWQEERLCRRSGLAPAEARAIIRAQAGRAEQLAAADDIIVNCGGREELLGALSRLHERYLSLAAQLEGKG